MCLWNGCNIPIYSKSKSDFVKDGSVNNGDSDKLTNIVAAQIRISKGTLLEIAKALIFWFRNERDLNNTFTVQHRKSENLYNWRSLKTVSIENTIRNENFLINTFWTLLELKLGTLDVVLVKVNYWFTNRYCFSHNYTIACF